MKTILSALAVASLLSSAASAEEAAVKSREHWSRARATHGGGAAGTVARHSAVMRPAESNGGRAFSPAASSNMPSFGARSSGPHGGAVQPLRPMPRSRTTGSGVYVAGGPAQGRAYTAEAASPARMAGAAAGTPIAPGKGGRSLAGPGITKGDPDTPPGGVAGDANGGDPLSKITASLGSMFGEMAKAMSAMWGGGG
jgi:hypothetical protein